MILAHTELLDAINKGELVFQPCNLNAVGPNSIDVHLGQFLQKVLPNTTVWCRETQQLVSAIDLRVPPVLGPVINLADGDLVIYPGELWLGATKEMIGSSKLVPLMHGCSTNGRSGLSPHANAGFGDLGFMTKWVLEITTQAHPLVLYLGMRIAQIEFCTASSNDYLYGKDCGVYATQQGVVGSIPH